MASPQRENGTIQIATEIWEALTKIRIPGEARQVLDFILRKTYGWNKKSDKISLSQFVENTGLKKNTVCKNLVRLQGMNLISITQLGNEIAKEYGFIKDYEKWKPLPKKVTLPNKVTSITQKGKRSLPNWGTTIDTSTIDTKKTISDDKRRKDDFETDKYPKTEYVKILDAYQKIKGIKLQGAEFLPPMREIKFMFKSGRTVEQITKAMEICNLNYEDWAMSTVRMKIADVVGGKLQPKTPLGQKETLIVKSKQDI